MSSNPAIHSPLGAKLRQALTVEVTPILSTGDIRPNIRKIIIQDFSMNKTNNLIQYGLIVFSFIDVEEKYNTNCFNRRL